MAYRETILAPAEAEGKYIHHRVVGQYGHCVIEIKPLARGEGLSLPTPLKERLFLEFIPSIEKGIREAMKKGTRWLSTGRLLK